MRILIVDDEEPRHQGFKNIFQNRYRVVHTYSCPEAISELLIQKFDVAFLDHDLHALDDGRDLCRWLLRYPSRCPPKIFIHSWNAYCAHEMRDMLYTLPSGLDIYQQPFSAYAEDPCDTWIVPHLESEKRIAEKSLANFTKVVRTFIEKQ